MPFKKVPFGNASIFNAVIEVPTGGQKKYEYDPEMEAMHLSGVLYGDLKYPLNYGHVPKTWAQDNNLLDVFVISTYPISTGTVVACRAVGMLEVMDRGKKDNKILAVPVKEPVFDHIKDVEDFPQEDLNKLQEFYSHLPEAWKIDIQLKGIKNREAAIKELLAAQESE